MTIRRVDDAVLLDDVCTVEDAEVLTQELQAGAAVIDWTACTHLHTACLQVILAAGRPVRGTPANPELARWLVPILHIEADSAPLRAESDLETAYRMEA